VADGSASAWPTDVERVAAALRADILEQNQKLLVGDPDVVANARKLGRCRFHEFARWAAMHRSVRDFTLKHLHSVSEQLLAAERTLNESFGTLRCIEARLASIPTGGRLLVGVLLAVGVFGLIAATIGLGLLLCGPVTRYLTLPLLGDAAYQITRLLAGLNEELALQPLPDQTALELLRPLTVFALGAATTAGLGVAVLLAPDLVCLFGRPNAGRRAAVLAIQVLFSASFYVIRSPDLLHPKAPVVAGTLFELTVMLMSTSTSIAIADYVAPFRASWRERAATLSGIRAIGVWQARLHVFISELTIQKAVLATQSWSSGLDEAAFVRQLEDYGAIVAELALLEAVLRNTSALQEGDGAASPSTHTELCAPIATHAVH
jgi:hypothetical protein